MFIMLCEHSALLHWLIYHHGLQESTSQEIADWQLHLQIPVYGCLISGRGMPTCLAHLLGLPAWAEVLSEFHSKVDKLCGQSGVGFKSAACQTLVA